MPFWADIDVRVRGRPGTLYHASQTGPKWVSKAAVHFVGTKVTIGIAGKTSPQLQPLAVNLKLQLVSGRVAHIDLRQRGLQHQAMLLSFGIPPIYR